MTLVLRDDDVRALAGFPDAVSIVADAIVSARRDTPRAAAGRSTVDLPGGWIRMISGTLPAQDVLGFKAFHLTSGGVRYVCALYRLSTGEPLALLDANHLTVARTSAAAASAARHYWGAAPISVAVIGSGTLARDGLHALASVCRIRAVRVFSPRQASRSSYAEEMGASLGLSVTPSESAAAATATADMVLCATQTAGVVALSDHDAGAARYVSSVSSTLPSQRELDERTLLRAAPIIIDTPDALAESGDLIAARAASADLGVVLLADFLSDTVPPSGELAVYKSIGSVEQDLALAAAVWRRAVALGAGQEMAPIESVRATARSSLPGERG